MDKWQAEKIIDQLRNRESVKDSDAKTAFEVLAEGKPSVVMNFAYLLEGKPYKDEIIDKTFSVAAETDPGSVLIYGDIIDGKSYKDKIIAKAFDKIAEDGITRVLIFKEQLEGKSYKDEILEKAFNQSIKSDPESVLKNVNLLEGKDYKEKTIKSAFETLVNSNDFESVFSNIEILKGKPYQDEILGKAFNEAAEIKPEEVFACYEEGYAYLIEGKPYENEVLKKAYYKIAETRPEIVFSTIKLLEGKEYKDDIIDKAFNKLVEENPRSTLFWSYNLKMTEGISYRDGVIDRAFQKALETDPLLVLEYNELLKNKSYKEEFLEKAFRATVENNPDKVLEYLELLENKSYKEEITEKAFRGGVETNPFLVLQFSKFLNDKPYENEVIKKIISREGGEKLLVEHFNTLHESPKEERFRHLKFLSPAQDFDLITKGREEAFTSTYLNIVDDMMAKLKKDNKMLTDVLSPDQKGRIDVFFEAAATYGKMDEVLKYIPQDKLPEIIHNMAVEVGKNDLSAASTMVNLMLSLKDNKSLKPVLEKEMLEQYNSAKTQDEKDKYGVLISAYVNNTDQSKISNEAKTQFLGIAHNKRYMQVNSIGLDKESLVDKNGLCNQLMVFSGDDDSKASYENWKNTYKNKAGWHIDETETYTHIYNTSGKVPVHIYANKPDKHDEGLKDINEKVKKDGGNFSVFVGRGHSYHAADYIKLIDDNMKLVALGSCGGYNNLSKVLALSPEAQVIATKQTGSMQVNDPLLFNINESIVQNGSVDWKDQQTKLDNVGSVNKEAYLLPNKNIDLNMIRKYNELQASPAITTPEQEQNQNPQQPNRGRTDR